MNDSFLPADIRAIEYFRFAEAFVDALDDAQDSTSVRSVIGLIDPETSLGCQTEKLLAKMLSLPVKKLSPVRKINKYTEAIEDHKLISDIDEIIKFGGTVVEISNGSMLVAKTVKS
ncbi:hypothetical protein KW794_01020 [Candidatus Saccharibacteria bacterium]|nr:hypothetical protein [Candidatus Saccharibacteria bacterium]